jgi:hypothetical protein
MPCSIFHPRSSIIVFFAGQRAFPPPALCATVSGMVHENLAQSIEDLSARIIAIRDSL